MLDLTNLVTLYGCNCLKQFFSCILVDMGFCAWWASINVMYFH